MIEGFVFEERPDDQPFQSSVAIEVASNLEQEFAEIVTQQSWQNPEEFGHLQSTFESHVQMIGRRSEELGIDNEYSEDALRQDEEMSTLLDTMYEQMVSYDEFYMMMCACPEDFGMTQSFASEIFGSEAMDDGHNHGLFDKHDKDEIDPKTGKKKKNNKKRSGVFAFLKKDS